MKIENFKYHERGMNRFFGPLEARVMTILWDNTELTIKDVQHQLQLHQEKPLSFNTVMTVMNRLTEKGFLDKLPGRKASLYRPTRSREAFLEAQSKELTGELLDEFGPLIVNHMVDALDEADPDLLDQLEKRIQQLKKDRS
ncbi:BlaI/MecI/CopY family transcriptional regulator [Paenibacillus daejeonensis]|uniref:BlaI/MecI/CopY family transcriptional regulator n=1 Tax=Paenibacillus daejeonensis TaxID=135193 RepID=UPI0003A7F9A1|nr:BlaI/MecI/CopY family transcriptional regulator [Paenibacillus daejeonensis]